MRILDLFAGIGGFSLAAHWMGWETVAFVERDKFCQKVLRKNFGSSIEIYDDITTFSGQPFRGRVDIVTGGFPCQPFSQAGKQKGKDDERHLFPEMLRVVAEVRPRWVVAENVRGLLSIADGDVFEEVAASLEGEGYEVQTFCIPACSVDAPHRRDRLWIVAHALADTDNERCIGRSKQGSIRERSSDTRRRNDRAFGESELDNTKPYSDTSKPRLQRSEQPRTLGERERPSRPITERAGDGWREPWIEAATRFCRVGDVVSDRVDRLKSLGNTVVPVLIYEIFAAIEAAQT